MYVKIPRDFYLGLRNELSVVAEYKINLQKSVAFVYSISEWTKNDITEIILFIVASRIKYLGINLTKEV